MDMRSARSAGINLHVILTITLISKWKKYVVIIYDIDSCLHWHRYTCNVYVNEYLYSYVYIHMLPTKWRQNYITITYMYILFSSFVGSRRVLLQRAYAGMIISRHGPTPSNFTLSFDIKSCPVPRSVDSFWCQRTWWSLTELGHV